MTNPIRSAKWLLLGLSALLVVAGCASPAPSASPTAESQPAAGEARPVEPMPTEVAAVGEATAAPVEEMPTSAPAEATAPPTSGGARTFVLAPGQSQASYEVDEEFLAGAADMLNIQPGKGKTVGKTDQVTGQLTLDFSSSTPQLVSGDFQVDISTLSSDQTRRDNRIRDEWLESARFPIATFKATAIQNAPDSYVEGEEVTFQLAGDLTVREVTQPVVFDVTATLQGDTIAGTGTTSFLMSQFGVTPPSMGNLFTVGDATTVTIAFVAKEE